MSNTSSLHMKEEILSSISNPLQLEKLYRSDKAGFRKAFNILYPTLESSDASSFWHARLNFSQEEISWGSRREMIFIILGCILAGFIAKIPATFHIDQELFYPRNIGFIVFPILTAFFAWKNKLSGGKIVFIAIATIASLAFINLLPKNDRSDTLILSCVHLLLFLWSILGFAFVGSRKNEVERRLSFLSYNGDLIVMTTLIVIAGAILTGVTIGLFSLIGFQIEKFYFENIVVFALPSAPIIGTYLTQTNPQLVGKVSPVIAKIFSPLVLLMLLIYLVAILYSGKDPYNDREFLFLFNALLIGVMAIIFFSVAEASRTAKTHMELWVLFLLSAVTIVVNGIALSAIGYRISTLGITPNRAAVLGGNVLILINLLLVTVQLFRVLRAKTEITKVGSTISLYLPVYAVWTIVVTFIFPFLFGMK